MFFFFFGTPCTLYNTYITNINYVSLHIHVVPQLIIHQHACFAIDTVCCCGRQCRIRLEYQLKSSSEDLVTLEEIPYV